MHRHFAKPRGFVMSAAMSLFQSGDLMAQIEGTLTLLSDRMKTFTGLGLNADAKLLEPFTVGLYHHSPCF